MSGWFGSSASPSLPLPAAALASLGLKSKLEGGSKEDKSRTPGTGPKKSINKKNTTRRQACACDGCRRTKKRCDGKSPCQRCQAVARICTYTPVNSKKKSRNNTSTTPEQTNGGASSPFQNLFPPSSNALSEQVVGRSFMNLFFDRMYLVNKVVPIPMSQFDRPTSKPVLLQFYTAAAAASRAFGGTTGQQTYRNFEQRAHQLASELFDHISEETAIGFHLLSYFTRGEDTIRANHYRDVTTSLCRRLMRLQATSHESRDRLLRLQMVSITLGPVDDPDMTVSEYTEIVDKAQSFVTPSPHPSGHGAPAVDISHPPPPVVPASPRDILPMSELIPMFVFGFKFRYIFEERAEDQDREHLTFRTGLQTSELNDLIFMVDEQIHRFVENKLVPPYLADLTRVCFHLYKVLVLFAGADEEESLALLRQCVPIIETNLHLLPCFPATMIELFHLCFLVAFFRQDYFLANKISGFQRRIADFLPAGRPLMQQDMERLKSLSPSAKAIPDASLNGDPSTAATLPFVEPHLLLSSATMPVGDTTEMMSGSAPFLLQMQDAKPEPAELPDQPSFQDGWGFSYGGLAQPSFEELLGGFPETQRPSAVGSTPAGPPATSPPIKTEDPTGPDYDLLSFLT